MAAPTFRSISTANGGVTSTLRSFNVAVPSDAVVGDALYLAIGWNRAASRTLESAPPTPWQDVTDFDNATGSDLSATRIRVFACICTAGMPGSQVPFSFNSTAVNGAYGASITALPGGTLTTSITSTYNGGTSQAIGSTVVVNSGAINTDRISLVFYSINASTAGIANAPLLTGEGAHTTDASIAAQASVSTGYGMGFYAGHGTAGVVRTLTITTKAARGGGGGHVDVSGPGPAKSGRGQLSATGSVKATRGKKGLTATRKGTITGTAVVRATRGVAKIPTGRGYLSATALINARTGSRGAIGNGSAITAVATLAALSGQRYEPKHVSGSATPLSATASLHALGGIEGSFGRGRLTAVVELSSQGEADPGVIERSGQAALSAVVTLGNVGWAYDPSDDGKFYGHGGDLTAVALLGNVTGAKNISYDQDLDPLASTSSFTQKGVTIAGGQGYLPVGTVLAERTADKKYVVVSLEDTDSQAVLLRTAVDATEEDVLATVIISGVIRLDLLSTDDIAKLDPLGAKVSTGKGTARI